MLLAQPADAVRQWAVSVIQTVDSTQDYFDQLVKNGIIQDVKNGG